LQKEAKIKAAGEEESVVKVSNVEEQAGRTYSAWVQRQDGGSVVTRGGK